MDRKRQSTAVVSDDEENVFENRKIILKKFSQVQKSPSKERRIDLDDDDNDDDLRLKYASLRMRIRRSTEQSSYKVENLPSGEYRRASLRKNVNSPSRYTPTDEIVDSGRRKSRNYLTGIDNSHQKNIETSESKNLRSPATKAAERLQKSLKISENEHNVQINSQLNKIDENNESDDSYISDIDNNIELITNRRSRANVKKKILTPLKKNVISDVQNTPTTRLRSSKNHLPTPKSTKKLFDDEPATPKRKSIASKTATPKKVGMLTPSVRQRVMNINKPKTILEEARAQLHVSAVPKSLPCRESEFNDIFMFLEKKIADHSSGCMYISGVPGTGKTATVNEVIRCLKKLTSKGSLPSFDFIEINGMKLSEPRQSYVQILKQMTGKSTTWEEALKILDKRFTNSANKKSMTLLLIDELDVLCNKRQDVVYNLLNWPSQPAAQLVVITIANTMDLPERVLMSRVTSRLGLTRLTFQPYNHKQLNEIVIARLNESDAFKSEAVQLVARKVAAVSGDARRALDICRRATEIAELYKSKIVSLQHVNEALSEMIASVKVRAIKHCSEMEKVFLQAVCAEITRTGVEETTFINVYKQLEALCSFEGVPIPSITQGLEICNRLSANRLILCDDPRSDIFQRIFLNVSSDDVHFALQNIEF